MPFRNAVLVHLRQPLPGLLFPDQKERVVLSASYDESLEVHDFEVRLVVGGILRLVVPMAMVAGWITEAQGTAIVDEAYGRLSERHAMLARDD